MSVKRIIEWLSPAGERARLSILIFHRVHRSADPLFPGEPDAAAFDAICGWLRAWFEVLPLSEAARRLREGSLPAGAAAITFDDGYADNHDVALPILQRHGLGATFFVATGFLDGGRMWNDTLVESVRRTPRETLDLQAAGLAGIGSLPLHDLPARQLAITRLIGACRYLPFAERDAAVAAVARAARAAGATLPEDLMMTSDQVRALQRAGMEIGGHTVHHPILTRVSASSARDEIAAGKSRLEEITQAPVRVFAYPNGRPREDYGAEHAAMVEALGFEAAVSTAWGVSTRATDPFQLPRFTPWDRSRLRFGLRLAHNLGWRSPVLRSA